MKHTFRPLVFFAVLLSAAAAQAQGFYVGAFAGPAFAHDADIEQFVFRGAGGSVEFDTGSRMNVAGGYQFNDFFAAQLGTGFIYNEIDRIGRGSRGDASLTHVPFLADLVLRYDRPDGRWVPYVGLGAGADASIVDFDRVRARGVFVDGTDTTVVFAWQAFLGARYKFNEWMSLGGGYRFFWADGPSWDVDRARGDIEFGETMVHSFGIDFTFTF
jgi:OmpA-OmpF porin, OOP family